MILRPKLSEIELSTIISTLKLIASKIPQEDPRGIGKIIAVHELIGKLEAAMPKPRSWKGIRRLRLAKGQG